MTTLPLARSTIRDNLANDPEADLAPEDASALFSLWERVRLESSISGSELTLGRLCSTQMI